MKQLHSIKNLFVAALLGATATANAQTAHPLAFDSTARHNYNWYRNYVGTRLEVTTPSSVAGDKNYTTSYPSWGGAITAPMVNLPVIMDYTDSSGCSPYTSTTYPAGRWIAMIWRGPLSAPCEFGYKALQAQTAGAAACIIVNEYPGQGPVGMGPGASGASVTIPVFMIGNLDGIAISSAYHTASSSPDSVRITITPWGLGNVNDLGIIPGGYSVWHDYAIPYWQLNGNNASPYTGINGAFVANFGSANASNVKLTTSTSFTPTGGSATVLHRDTTSLASFPALDSIWALFGPQYNLPALTGNGRYDINYNVTSSIPDQYAGDNSLTYSFYTTDSLFCKSRYDFVNNHPIANEWFRYGLNYMWGVPYYINNGGIAIKNLQFTIAGSNDPLPTADPVNFYIFKWIGGTHDTEYVKEEQMQLVGAGTKSFDGLHDSSYYYYTVSPIVLDTVNFTGSGNSVRLDSSSWYIVAADVPYNGSTQYYLGVDGVLNGYPREYGRAHFNNKLEFFNTVIDTTQTDFRAFSTGFVLNPYPYGGVSLDVDSVVFKSQVGLIPAIAMNITKFDTSSTPPPPPPPGGVHNVSSTDRFELYPNPTSSDVTVALLVTSPVKVVSYTIINSVGRIVSRDTKYNVQNEKYTYSTKALPAGNYFMVVNADGRQMYKKFTVVKE
jgi:hypothetical protein